VCQTFEIFQHAGLRRGGVSTVVEEQRDRVLIPFPCFTIQGRRSIVIRRGDVGALVVTAFSIIVIYSYAAMLTIK
jgi:hypothetical protein